MIDWISKKVVFANSFLILAGIAFVFHGVDYLEVQKIAVYVHSLTLINVLIICWKTRHFRGALMALLMLIHFSFLIFLTLELLANSPSHETLLSFGEYYNYAGWTSFDLWTAAFLNMLATHISWLCNKIEQ